MRYMLDTNTIIYLIKHQPPSVAVKVDQLNPNDQLIMSFVTYAELLKGAENSQRKDKVIAQLKALTQVIDVVYPNNPAICQHYAVQFLKLKAKGTPIGGNDLWIACHALAEDAILVTHNTREFERIEGLKLEDWV
jgi:tRNA(fMet)-specific endonuclease VapC